MAVALSSIHISSHSIPHKQDAIAEGEDADISAEITSREANAKVLRETRARSGDERSGREQETHNVRYSYKYMYSSVNHPLESVNSHYTIGYLDMIPANKKIHLQLNFILYLIPSLDYHIEDKYTIVGHRPASIKIHDINNYIKCLSSIYIILFILFYSNIKSKLRMNCSD